MRYFYLIMVMAVCITSKAQFKKTYSGQYFITKANCAGAAETEGAKLYNETNIAFANQTIYLYKKNKCVDSIVTDKEGKFSKKLNHGKYAMFLPYKHYKTIPFGSTNDFKMECMEKEWLIPDAILKVSWKGTHRINYRIAIQFCEWQYNCLKNIRIPPSQN